MKYKNIFRLNKILVAPIILLVSSFQVHAAEDTLGQTRSGIGAIMSAISIYLHHVEAKNHDQITIEYANSILSAISQMNTLLDNLVEKISQVETTTCNLYQHRTNQSYAAFRLKMTDYMGRSRKSLFISDLEGLQWFVADIRKNFEDHLLLSGCALDQYTTYPLYLTLTSLDMNLQYEYISQLYKIAFLGNPDGTLNDPSTLDPGTMALMSGLIESETQSALKIRVQDAIQHIRVLDGATGRTSWRSKSDEQFSPVLGRYTQYTSDNYWYRFNGQDYEVFSGLLFGNRFVNIWEGCQGPNYNWTLASQGICKPTALPYFVQIKQDPAQFAYYANNPRDLYTRHKNDAYIELAKNVFEPSIPILKSWVDLITDGSVSYPVLTVENDLATYVPF